MRCVAAGTRAGGGLFPVLSTVREDGLGGGIPLMRYMRDDHGCCFVLFGGTKVMFDGNVGLRGLRLSGALRCVLWCCGCTTCCQQRAYGRTTNGSRRGRDVGCIGDETRTGRYAIRKCMQSLDFARDNLVRWKLCDLLYS